MIRKYLLVIALLMSCCSAFAQEVQDSVPMFNPADVLVVEDDMEELERAASVAVVAGRWQYSKPYVHARGTTLMGKLGKPIAKSKLKKQLDKAYKKLKIHKRFTSLSLGTDGKWQIGLAGRGVGGSYTYNRDTGQLSMKIMGIPVKSHVERDGNKLYLCYDIDRLLVIMSVLSGLSHNETLKALSFLSQNFSDVMVGFELKPAK